MENEQQGELLEEKKFAGLLRKGKGGRGVARESWLDVI
jgi:hypothetical protein